MKLADLFEAEDVEAEDVDLMMQLAKMLFDKGELHIYWRIDKKHSAAYQGLVVAFNIREYKGADELVVTLRKPDEVRVLTKAGYFLADLTTKGQLTKIGRHHALLLTGNFSE